MVVKKTIEHRYVEKIDFIGHFFYLSFDAAHRKHWCSKSKSLVQQTDPLMKPILKSIDCVIL